MALSTDPERDGRLGEKGLHPDLSPPEHLSPIDSEDALADYHGISESKLLRKLDLHLLPAVCTLYLLSFLDRSNVGNAKLEGLTKEIGITGNQYLTGLTIFFVGYVMFEVIWNVILKRIGPRIWLPFITFLWGIVATLQGVIVNNGGSSGLAGFLIVRWVLGVTEGGLFPGVVFYISMWYTRRERQYRVALFFGMASLAGAFGGILAYGISKMNGVGGYSGWVRPTNADCCCPKLTVISEMDLHYRRSSDHRDCRRVLLVHRRLAEQSQLHQRE